MIFFAQWKLFPSNMKLMLVFGPFGHCQLEDVFVVIAIVGLLTLSHTPALGQFNAMVEKQQRV